MVLCVVLRCFCTLDRCRSGDEGTNLLQHFCFQLVAVTVDLGQVVVGRGVLDLLDGVEFGLRSGCLNELPV